jgi:hypothetical protein
MSGWNLDGTSFAQALERARRLRCQRLSNIPRVN